MSQWRVITVTARNIGQPELYARVTLAVRPSRRRRNVISRIPSEHPKSFTVRNIKGKRVNATGVEDACFSGAYYAAHVVETELYDVEILEVDGLIDNDGVGFALATSAGVISVLRSTAAPVDDPPVRGWCIHGLDVR